VIVWRNGTFGCEKTTTAAELRSLQFNATRAADRVGSAGFAEFRYSSHNLLVLAYVVLQHSDELAVGTQRQADLQQVMSGNDDALSSA
jgi:hypothetical protein